MEVVAACVEKGSAPLGLQDGRALVLPCSRKLGIPDALYTVSISQLLSALQDRK